MISADLYPKISPAPLFHVMTLPAESSMKMA